MNTPLGIVITKIREEANTGICESAINRISAQINPLPRNDCKMYAQLFEVVTLIRTQTNRDLNDLSKIA